MWCEFTATPVPGPKCKIQVLKKYMHTLWMIIPANTITHIYYSVFRNDTHLFFVPFQYRKSVL